jgi:sulfate adenylyltransferase subunit 1 (EFTu-like GTPase family)
MLSMSNLVTIIAALLPAIITVIGGQAILIRYRKSKEGVPRTDRHNECVQKTVIRQITDGLGINPICLDNYDQKTYNTFKSEYTSKD